MPISASEFVPRDYQRSADRERLFEEKNRATWDAQSEYDAIANTAVDYLCRNAYSKRPDIGHLNREDRMIVSMDENKKVTRIYFRTKSAFPKVDRMVGDPKIKLILIPISLWDPTGGHAILLVIDKERKQLEFYDPNGADAHQRMYGTEVIPAVHEIIGDTWPTFDFKKYKPLMWEQTCSRAGVQAIEAFMPKKKSEVSGYCVLWSVFLMDLRIRYPEYNPIQAQTEFIRGMMRRAVPTLQLQNEEVEALMASLFSRRKYDDILQKYFKSADEATQVALKLSNTLREFIKNYFSYLTKIMTDERVVHKGIFAPGVLPVELPGVTGKYYSKSKSKTKPNFFESYRITKPGAKSGTGTKKGSKSRTGTKKGSKSRSRSKNVLLSLD